ncbi:voltage-gated chloride channel [Arenibacter echinorum]|uniref:Voltage-gated chloride channel n=1 Tax=Arenibacter echinorum TaxID=440515 RepID=A0A327RDI3_9FLAO|nr:chloride channel protein [Arenibacter echinorum]RAJ14278.1 voltage-gated chloride channel [Arenibacter echinorum]
MKLKRRRKLITYLNILDQPIRFNPFVFSRTFLLWAVLGLVGGFIIPLFFVGVSLGLILYVMFPSINSTLAIISCMAAINACVTRTPMSTTILLATLTGFGYFIPILFASLTGYFLAPRIPFISSQMEK